MIQHFNYFASYLLDGGNLAAAGSAFAARWIYYYRRIDRDHKIGGYINKPYDN